MRQHFRLLRQRISPAQQALAAQAAAQLLMQQPCFQQSQHIACYVAVGSEFATQPIMQALWQANKQCYLPVARHCEEGDLTGSLVPRDKLSNPEKILQFSAYNKGDNLQPNQYNIPEPLPNAPQINAEQLDLVIAPLLAFDLQGHRLGTGGGYYDRTFAFLRDETINKPLLIGLGYAAQQVEALSADAWDVKLNAVLTEDFFRIV